MFKDKELRVRVHKVGEGSAAESVTIIDPEELNAILKEQAVHIGVTVVGVYAAITTIKTISTLIINIAPKR